eukprot:s1651_g7.t1
MDLHFVWQAWHLRHWAGSGDGRGRRWSRVAPRLFCVAGVALGDICLCFVWQAWHLATWTFTLCGRRGTYGTGLALVTAVVTVGPVWRRASFAWQARAVGPVWRRASFAWQVWRLVTSAFVLCGRRGTWCGKRGTYGTGLALVTALVAAGPVWRRASFAWQAWHLVTSAVVSCGRRGAW